MASPSSPASRLLPPRDTRRSSSNTRISGAMKPCSGRPEHSSYNGSNAHVATTPVTTAENRVPPISAPSRCPARPLAAAIPITDRLKARIGANDRNRGNRMNWQPRFQV